MRVRDWRLRTKLLVSLLLFSALIICSVSVGFVHYSADRMTEIASNNAHEILRKNNEILGARLSYIAEQSNAFLIDESIFACLQTLPVADPTIWLAYNRRIRPILSRYFMQQQQVTMVQLATRSYVFGYYGEYGLPMQGDITGTPIYREAQSSGGSVVWVPPYCYTEAFGFPFADLEDPEQWVFTAAWSSNNIVYSSIDNTLQTLTGWPEPPVVMVHFSYESIKELAAFDTAVEGAQSFIATPDGQIVYHPEFAQVGTRLEAAWFAAAVKRGSGQIETLIDGRQTLVCFDTSPQSGWISCVLISMDELRQQNMAFMMHYVLPLSGLVVLAACLFSLLFSYRITKPLEQVMSFAQNVGEGDFELRMQSDRRDEMGMLIHRLNDMNAQIGSLLRDNRSRRIEAINAQLSALLMEVNPHFLYNTINAINWVALEKEQTEISEMLVSLSYMLQYTVGEDHPIVRFEDDLRWLKSYIFIMSIRFEDRFAVTCDMEDALNDAMVPRLFLQPILENAYLHAFPDDTKAGEILIRGRIQGERVVFEVRDNGCGIDEVEQRRLWIREKASVGIRNVRSRLKLHYQDECDFEVISEPGQGTCVRISFPFQTEQDCP